MSINIESMSFEEKQGAAILKIQSMENNINNNRSLEALLKIFEKEKNGIPIYNLQNPYISYRFGNKLENDIKDRLQENGLMLSAENIQMVSQAINYGLMDHEFDELIYRSTNDGLKEASRKFQLEPDSKNPS